MLYRYDNTVESSYTGDLRHYIEKMKEYLEKKCSYYDPVKEVFTPFPVKYAAPNLVFSDDKGQAGVSKENSIEQRIIIPIMSFYLQGMEYDSARAIDPCVRYKFKPKNSALNGPALVTTAPKPMKYSFQVDIWTFNREQLLQVSTAFQLDFNPYSYLYDLFRFDDETKKTDYIPYVKMTLDSYTDTSNFIPGTDRRVVRGTLKISVEGWLTQPPKEINYIRNTRLSTATSSGVEQALAISNNGVLPIIDEGQDVAKVNSVFGRTGQVDSETGDYTAQEVLLTGTIPGVANVGDSIQTALGSLAAQITHTTDTVILGETLIPGTAYTLSGGKAYKVTSADLVTPSVDGVTVSGGNANSQVNVAKTEGQEYIMPFMFTSTGYIYLSTTGQITNVIPDSLNGDKYLYILGRCINNSNSFIFSPKIPIEI